MGKESNSSVFCSDPYWIQWQSMNFCTEMTALQCTCVSVWYSLRQSKVTYLDAISALSAFNTSDVNLGMWQMLSSRGTLWQTIAQVCLVTYLGCKHSFAWQMEDAHWLVCLINLWCPSGYNCGRICQHCTTQTLYFWVSGQQNWCFLQNRNK